MCAIKLVSTISYKLLVGISQNLQLGTVGDRDEHVLFLAHSEFSSEGISIDGSPSKTILF